MMIYCDSCEFFFKAVDAFFYNIFNLKSSQCLKLNFRKVFHLGIRPNANFIYFS